MLAELVAASSQPSKTLQDLHEKALTTKEGLEAFERALNSNLTQVIVSPENLEHLLEESEAVFDPTK
jgi:hypothetical protein